MPSLTLDSVSKVYPCAGGAPAVDHLSFSVENGELLVLLGPSGCGKTTTIRLIAGLEQVSEGRIFLDGKEIQQKPPGERNAALVFQYPALLPQLNVERNIALGLTLRGTPTAKATAAAKDLCSSLGLLPLLTRLPATLSGGQQQRVALARALIIRPALLLLDEPLANLDPIARAELRPIIHSLQRETGATTIYVTHDQREAVALADRIAIMNAGRVEQIGTARELYDNPRTLFVARFFSPEEVNVLEGSALADFIQIPNAHDRLLLIRSEHLVVDPQGPIRGKIIEVQEFGWKTQAKVRIGNSTVTAEAPPTTRAGDEIQVRIVRSFQFKVQSGERLA